MAEAFAGRVWPAHDGLALRSFQIAVNLRIVRFGAVFTPRELDTIPEIAQLGKPWDIPESPEALGAGPLAAECVVPILGRNSRLIGLLVLGPRLSEESYSSEDKRLLDSVASQAGITLENLDLAEKMAKRMEERKADMETGFEP